MKTMKILAVDDDASIRTLITLILSDAGYDEVITFASADEALKAIKLENVPFDCFLLDIQMPDRDGIMLCQDIRHLDGYGKSPIIMLTAMHEHSYVTDAFQVGATDYISKPFDVADLCTRVKLAELMVERQRQSEHGGPEGRERTGDLTPELDRRLAEKAKLLGIDGLLPAETFENYLRQISRAGLQVTKVFAIRIERIEFLVGRCSASEFEDMLRHTADAILETFSTSHLIMTYVGYGSFMAASHSGPFAPAEVERSIQHVLDEKELSFANGDPLDVDVALGSPVTPLLNSVMGIDMVVGQAIEHAIARMGERSRCRRPINIKSV